MTRILCCLVLTCLVTACAPKRTEVVEAPVTPPKRNHKPATATTDAPVPEVPRVVNPDGMMIPPLENRLPDRNDMTATAPPAPGGGVIATPPRKPVNE